MLNYEAVRVTLTTAHLALGNSGDPARFADHIDAVLCCASEIPLFPGKPGHHLRIDDGSPIGAEALERAYRFLDEQLGARHLVLVYCGHGLSRSPSVLSGYLALKQGAAPAAILASIQRLRPEVEPSAVTFRSVERYVHEITAKLPKT